MSKYLRILVLALLVVCMAAGASFAGTLHVWNARPSAGGSGADNSTTVALEIMGTTRTISLDNATDNATVTYVPGQNLSTSNLLKLTLAGGAKFTASTQLIVCRYNADNTTSPVATGTPSATDITNGYFYMQMTDNVTSSPQQVAYLSYGSTCLPLISGAGTILNRPGFKFDLSATTSAVTPTLMIEGTSGAISLDTTAAVTLATVSSEYSSSVTGTSHVVDYLASPYNGSKILNGAYTTLQDNATTDVATVGGVGGGGFSIKITAAARSNSTSSAGLNLSGTVALADTASWAGVTSVWVQDNTTTNCQDANAVRSSGAKSTSPSGTVTLTLDNLSKTDPATGASKGYLVCVNVAGNSGGLAARTITATPTITLSSGGNAPTLTGGTAQTWTVNGFEAYVPHILASTSYKYYCSIANIGTTPSTAKVYVTPVATCQGGASTCTAGAKSQIEVGSLSPAGAGVITFASDASAQWNASTAVATGLTTGDRYDAKLMVTAARDNIQVSCWSTDQGTGATRNLPVLTDASVSGQTNNGTKWKN